MRVGQRLFVAVVVAFLGCDTHSEPNKSPNTQSTPETVENAVRKVISKLMKVDSAAIPMDTPISDAPLKADDLDLVEIVMELEEQLGIQISDAALEQYSGKLGKSPIKITPNQLVTIVRQAPKAQESKRKR